MSTLPAVQEQQGLSRLDPQALLAKAIEAGTSVEAIEKLVDLAIRMRDVQAKEAYSAAPRPSKKKEAPRDVPLLGGEPSR